MLQTVRMFSVALDGLKEPWNTVIPQQTHKLLRLVWGQGEMHDGLRLMPVLLLDNSPSILFGICRSGWEGSCFVSKRVYAHEHPLSRCHSALGAFLPLLLLLCDASRQEIFHQILDDCAASGNS